MPINVDAIKRPDTQGHNGCAEVEISLVGSWPAHILKAPLKSDHQSRIVAIVQPKCSDDSSLQPGGLGMIKMSNPNIRKRFSQAA